MTQSIILMATLATMSGLLIGYCAGILVDPRRMPMIGLRIVMDLYRVEHQASKMERLALARVWKRIDAGISCRQPGLCPNGNQHKPG
jgi:hypothetical protein